jgi:hypothetical protein
MRVVACDTDRQAPIDRRHALRAVLAGGALLAAALLRAQSPLIVRFVQ